MQTWITELKQLGPQNIVLAITGNKSDLEQARKVCVCACVHVTNHLSSRCHGPLVKPLQRTQMLYLLKLAQRMAVMYTISSELSVYIVTLRLSVS